LRNLTRRVRACNTVGMAAHSAPNLVQLSFVKFYGHIRLQEFWPHWVTAVLPEGMVSVRSNPMRSICWELAVPADGSCPEGRLVAGGVDVRHGYLDRAGVFNSGVSAIVGGAAAWVSQQSVGGKDLAQPFFGA
jgi:hypothetical protein